MFEEGLGHPRSTGGHHDGIEGRRFGVAEGAIAPDDVGVAIAQILQCTVRTVGQCLVAFDRPHLGRHAAQHRGPVARTGTDLQHAVLRTDLGCLGHRGHDVGLRDRLSLRDRQGMVLVCELGLIGRDEPFTGNGSHGSQHPGMDDSPPGQVALDHPGAGTGETGTHLGTVRT